MDLAQSIIKVERKEVRNMKIATSLLAALLFTSALGGLNKAVADDGVLLKQEVTPGSYCQEKFRAIRGSTLAGNEPELNPTGDIIDFSGPCDEKPTGNDQVQSQRIENQHHWVTSFYANH
jgi:hypothetical protein